MADSFDDSIDTKVNMKHKSAGDSDVTLMKFDRYPSTKLPQVVFLLDITGSMSTQIEAVKGMVSEFCAVPRPDMDIHIFTYTESADGCYVTRSPLSSDPSVLHAYVKSITLSQPPGMPSVSACGDDYPENLLSALATLLLSFNSSHNIFCFVITDAPPHYKADNSPTARKERSWLAERGFAPNTQEGSYDAYVFLNNVIDSLNVTLIPVLYSSVVSDPWFEQASFKTDSLTMMPESSAASVLRDGLVAVLEALNTVAVSRQVTPESVERLANRCTGFSIRFPAPDFEVLEAEPTSTRTSLTSYTTDPKVILEGLTGFLRTACDRFAGKRAAKRIREVNVDIISSSIQVFAWTVLHLVGSNLDADGSQWTAAVHNLKDKLGISSPAGETSAAAASAPSASTAPANPDLAAEGKVVARWFESLSVALNLADARLQARDLTAAQRAELVSRMESVAGVSCAVSLDSVTDVLKQIDEIPPSTEDGLKTWMDIVLRSTICRLVNVIFPKDANGNPDFYDAWSAVVNGFSLSTVLSASSAASLRDKETGKYKDPLTRAEFSTALVVAHPDDPILTTAYRVLSALPSLMGLVQGYLVSGHFKIFPSLLPGIQASTLLRLMQTVDPSRTLTEAEWELARILVHSLRSIASHVAVETRKDLIKKRHFNPSDAPAKLLAASIRSMSPGALVQPESESVPFEVFGLLFDELAGDAVAYIQRKRMQAKESEGITFESDLPTETEIIHGLFPLQSDEGFDPLQAYHPIEIACQLPPIEFLPPKGTPILSPELEERFQRNVLVHTKVFKKLVHLFQGLCSILHTPVTDKKTSSILWGHGSPLSEDQMLKKYYTAVVLGKRVRLYDLIDPPEENNWVLASHESVTERISSSIRDLLQTVYQKELKEWNTIRANVAGKAILEQVQSLPASDTFDQSNVKLGEIKHTLLGKTYRLQRQHAVKLAPKLSDGQRNNVLLALILGSWSTSPPSELRRSLPVLLEYFADKAIRDRIQSELSAKAMCQRATSNRHGHSKSNVYPGMNGWSAVYESTRLGYAASLVHKRAQTLIASRLQAMKARSKDVEELKKSLALNESGVGANRQKLLSLVVHLSESVDVAEWVKQMSNEIKKREHLDSVEHSASVDAIVARLSGKSKHAGHKFAIFLKSVDGSGKGTVASDGKKGKGKGKKEVKR